MLVYTNEYYGSSIVFKGITSLSASLNGGTFIFKKKKNGQVSELVYETDLKSVACIGVWVRVPSYPPNT